MITGSILTINFSDIRSYNILFPGAQKVIKIFYSSLLYIRAMSGRKKKTYRAHRILSLCTNPTSSSTGLAQPRPSYPPVGPRYRLGPAFVLPPAIG
jgi:hypothetical protein